MVYFTCQHCGESVNKPRVEKHYDTKCKFKVPYLTCVDCLKDFNGQEYNVHTQCISEAERYSAKGTVFKQPSGMKKQTQYIELIQTLLNSKKMTHVQRQLLEICAAQENVPRKLKKFQNFMCNVGRSIPHSKQDEVDVFQLIETAWKNETNEKTKISQANQNNDESKVDGICDDTSTEMKNISNVQDSSLDSNKSKNNNQENELMIADDRKMNIEYNANSEEVKENINTLTKKQLKKQKKYEKYLAELKNQDKPKENQEEETSSSENSKKKKKNSKMMLNNFEAESMEVEQETKQKKSKKRKLNDLDTEQTNGTSSEISKADSPQNDNEEENKTHKKKAKKLKKQEIMQNGGVQSVDALEITKPGTIPKKNKKQKMEETLSDNMDKQKKAKVDDEDDNGSQTTFDWTSVIWRVLESRPDKELSIKRLGKKVIDEYQTIRPDHRSYEDLLAKFNKKVNKTKGVRVLKDKAKLIT